MPEIINTGAVEDPRPKEDRLKDYSTRELFGAAGVPAAGAVEWKEKPESAWPHYPEFDQDGSSSCVANGSAKGLGILNVREEGVFMDLSRRDFYSRRANKPAEGMWGADAGNIGVKGVTLESLMPSQGRSEAQMNDASDRKPSFDEVAKIFRAKSWLSLPLNIDAVAGAIESAGHAILFFKWAYSEWDQVVPTIAGTDRPNHHCIAGVDYFMHNGKKAVLIDESWGPKNIKQRIVTEDWFRSFYTDPNGRMTWAHYFVNLSNIAQNEQILPDKPKFRFTKSMKVGDQNPDVAMLQRCLGYLKDADGYLFPLTQSPTGLFGGITRSAVKRFQAIHGIPQTGEVYELTLAALNTEFA